MNFKETLKNDLNFFFNLNEFAELAKVYRNGEVFKEISVHFDVNNDLVEFEEGSYLSDSKYEILTDVYMHYSIMPINASYVAMRNDRT